MLLLLYLLLLYVSKQLHLGLLLLQMIQFSRIRSLWLLDWLLLLPLPLLLLLLLLWLLLLLLLAPLPYLPFMGKHLLLMYIPVRLLGGVQLLLALRPGGRPLRRPSPLLLLPVITTCPASPWWLLPAILLRIVRSPLGAAPPSASVPSGPLPPGGWPVVRWGGVWLCKRIHGCPRIAA